ncbi:hypothetical protein Tco_1125264 [Tanacetum coccineum]|uniref:Uncharacterized protein n=1 Tax=Tanacetum coccineum TaxID=301880 RepID=A0ABQ5JCL1_9ASTR
MDRFKKENGYHAIPPPLIGNYMPLLAGLSFTGLDDSVYKPTTNKTSASVSQVETSITPPSNTSVEMPRVESVRPSGVIIEDWRMPKESVLGKGTGHREVRPICETPMWKVSKVKVNTVKVNGVNTAGQIAVCTVKGNRVTDVKASVGCAWRPKMIDLNNGSKDNSRSWISKRVNYINPQGRLKNKALLTDYKILMEVLLPLVEVLEVGIKLQKLQVHRNYANTGLKKNVDAGQTEEENVSTQQYIVFPLWSSISSNYKSSDDKAKLTLVDVDVVKKTVQEPASEYDQALKNVLDKMMDQEKEATEQSDVVRKEFEAQCDSQLLQEKITRASSTNSFNTVSTPVNTASASRTFSP